MIPFTSHPPDSVAALGESALLRAIRGWLGPVAPPMPGGMGDDCAVLDTGDAHQLLATTDGVAYGRHFDDSTPAAAAGAKLLKRNLSDIAAMGGKPGPALINLFISRNTATNWLELFYVGLAECCGQYGVSIVGGDMAEAPEGVFAAHLTLMGTPGKNILLRTGAKIGDVIYVTGELGGSILGKHLNFTPRLSEGQWLARGGLVRGVIDITDGLAKDLPDILPADSDARLDSAALPISAAAHELAARDGKSPLLHALTDGEDYELLFALDPNAAEPETFELAWRKKHPTRLTRLGAIAPAQDSLPDQDRQLRDHTMGALLLPPDAHGYEHLRP